MAQNRSAAQATRNRQRSLVTLWVLHGMLLLTVAMVGPVMLMAELPQPESLELLVPGFVYGALLAPLNLSGTWLAMGTGPVRRRLLASLIGLFLTVTALGIFLVRVDMINWYALASLASLALMALLCAVQWATVVVFTSVIRARRNTKFLCVVDPQLTSGNVEYAVTKWRFSLKDIMIWTAMLGALISVSRFEVADLWQHVPRLTATPAILTTIAIMIAGNAMVAVVAAVATARGHWPQRATTGGLALAVLAVMETHLVVTFDDLYGEALLSPVVVATVIVTTYVLQYVLLLLSVALLRESGYVLCVQTLRAGSCPP